MNESDYALLLDSVDKITADLAKGLLEGADIPSYSHSPDFDVAELGAAAHGMIRGISIYVRPPDLERAKALLAEAWPKDAEGSSEASD